MQQHGRADADYEILVQLPGVDDPARVKEIMQTAAMLEITEVKDGPFPSKDAALAKHGGVLPLGTKLLQDEPPVPTGVNPEVVVSGEPVPGDHGPRSAQRPPSQDEMNKWETDFSLTQDGGSGSAGSPRGNIGNRLAVVLDNQIVSVADHPERGSKIRAASRAWAMSRKLRTWRWSCGRVRSRPACVYEEERTVGPSLGADSIRDGLLAGLAGLLAVIFAMLVYYKQAGINAVLALILNTMILLAALAYFDAVLTLPGIAGVILTIGMAVDSNVLIFERIREELRAGKGVIAAVDTGFSKALLDHYRYPRHHGGLLRFPVHVRNGPGEGLCGDAGDRLDRQCLYGGLRIADHLRLVAEPPPAGDGFEYLGHTGRFWAELRELK